MGSLKDMNAINISDYMESSYLDYSMYVILDRSLPSIADGLKPVQRRIVYAMNDLHLDFTAKYKKSARTVGDVLGKYHPHGDSACYEAMVMMAQSFSYRYPIIDGQGNWGSTDDPKSYAAMRYTESKMTKYAGLLLNELKEGTTDYKPNFDGTMDEPILLPAQIPNILLNGAMGIAVGMATDIPPHNIGEVISATQAYIKNNAISLDELMDHIHAPDYPTGGNLIYDKAAIRDIYNTGKGSIKLRASYKIEGNNIVIHELPYQVSGIKIIEQIAKQVELKKLPMIDDLQDESDKNHPIRIVISLVKNNKIDIEDIVSHLFSITDLEKSYKVNMNMIGLDGNPSVKRLVDVLSEWTEFRFNVVTRRFENKLRKIINRLHIVDGLLIAYLNIDEVINIIRTEEEPKKVLMARFGLTDIQANAILDTKLRNLAKLEEIQLETEKNELNNEKLNIEEILSSKDKLNGIIIDELEFIKNNFDDKRKTRIVSFNEIDSSKSLNEDELIPSEPISVMVSQKGWIRAGKNHNISDDGLSYKTGDGPLALLQTYSNRQTVLLDDDGKCYTVKNHLFPSARGYGDHLTKYIEPSSGAKIISIFDPSSSEHIGFASKGGYGFIGNTSEAISAMKKGKQIVKSDSKTLPSFKIIEDGYVCTLSKKGKILIFPVDEMSILGKGKGVKLINLNKDDELLYIFSIKKDASIEIKTSTKIINIDKENIDFYVGNRNRRGKDLHDNVISYSLKDVTSKNDLFE